MTDLLGALEEALHLAGLARNDVSAIATLEAKAETEAFRRFADCMKIAVVPVSPSRAAMFDKLCLTSSSVSEKHTGLSSVAESTALSAVLSNDSSAYRKLLVPRVIHGHATCALACFSPVERPQSNHVETEMSPL
ncbi:cobalamin biosynthesis protein [Notoacmeibacter sp. MSK16QG-6]|nr:cobalamin biosynthesis protein [Notoacmeibacter sp. MSK16QG-6]